MNCQNCQQALDPGAAFCGNCGQPAPYAERSEAYAFAVPASHAGESQALLSLLFGIGGIVSSLFIALGGVAFGLAGIVMGTLSRGSRRRGLSTVGIIVSSLSILVGMAVSVYAYNQHQTEQNLRKSANIVQSDLPAVGASELSTPCYGVGFVDELNVKNRSGNCDMVAFNGQTINESTRAYKIYASTSPGASETTFASYAKPALEKDIATNLPGFTIDSKRIATFAGSPAYIIQVSDKVNNISIIEAAVLHETTHGKNVFVLVHAVNGDKANLDTLEAQWLWK